MVLVGNIQTLIKDQKWRELIQSLKNDKQTLDSVSGFKEKFALPKEVAVQPQEKVKNPKDFDADLDFM
jgi:hypothetical protein